MPIVVRELVIRARVEELERPARNRQPGGPSARTMGEAEKEQLVALCVEKVMDAIERKMER